MATAWQFAPPIGRGVDFIAVPTICSQMSSLVTLCYYNSHISLCSSSSSSRIIVAKCAERILNEIESDRSWYYSTDYKNLIVAEWVNSTFNLWNIGAIIRLFLPTLFRVLQKRIVGREQTHTMHGFYRGRAQKDRSETGWVWVCCANMKNLI